MPKLKDHSQESQTDIDQELDQLFEGSWDVPAKDFEEVPDSTYQVRVLAALLNKAKSSGRLQCSWEVIILSGDHKGRHLYKHDGLDTEDGIGYFKGSLARLGRDEPKNKKELGNTLQEIVEAPTYATMKLTTRKKRGEDGTVTSIQNKRFVKALDSAEVDDDFEESELIPTLNAEPLVDEGGQDISSEDVGTVEETPSIQKGSRVKTTIDGVEYQGIVTKIKSADVVVVKFDDNDVLEIDISTLELVEEEASAEATSDWSVGDRVEVTIDAVAYKGKVTKLHEDMGTATIKFDDGDILDIELSDLEKPKAAVKTVKGKTEPKPSAKKLSCDLKIRKLKPSDRREADRWAKKLGFNPKDYETVADMLVSMAQYKGIKGVFKEPSSLIKALSTKK